MVKKRYGFARFAGIGKKPEFYMTEVGHSWLNRATKK
jgi:hypothetical protein